MTMTTQSEIQNLIDVWEHELDCLGPFASQEVLAAHLAKAPACAPNRHYLSEVVAGLK